MNKPDWLPDILNLDGDWNQVISILYTVFERDIKQGKPYCDGLPVWYIKKVCPDDPYGFEEIFWHIITKDMPGPAHMRLPDFRRAERLPWFKPSLENLNHPEVLSWYYEEADGSTKLYVWLFNFDYVVILKKIDMKRGPVLFINTAFYIYGDSKRKDLRDKYKKRII